MGVEQGYAGEGRGSGGARSPLRQTLGAHVASRRHRLGWSLATLAERSGLSRGTLFQVERAGVALRIRRLCGLARALDCAPSWLLEGDERVGNVVTVTFFPPMI